MAEGIEHIAVVTTITNPATGKKHSSLFLPREGMAIAYERGLKAIHDDIRTAAQSTPTSKPEPQGHAAARDNAKVGNCQGPIRSITFVKGMFIFGTTGMTNDVTVE